MLKIIFYYKKMSKYKVHGSGQGAVSILGASGNLSPSFWTKEETVLAE